MTDKGRLYFNGTVRTMDRNNPAASAVAVKDGLILAVGDRDACAAALPKGYEPVDLKGETLLPGFIDTHIHPVLLIFFALNSDLGHIISIEELKRELRAGLSRKKDNSWLVGLNFDEQNLKGKIIPSRQDLDEVCADRPVIVVKHDGHSVFANTCAVRAAGITASTPDPKAGKIERDEGGYPSGAFREAASQLVLNAMPVPDLPALADASQQTFQHLASLGLTSLGIVLQTGEEGPAGSAGAFDVMAMQLFSASCPFSLYSLLITPDIEGLDDLRASALSAAPNRLGGIKLFADGTFGSSTAYMLTPFSDGHDKKGLLMHPPQELYRQMTAAHNAGWQVCIHAIGDAANRLCAEMYGRLLREYPRRGCRHRIEHASIMDEWTMQELARLGIVVSTQPMFIHTEKGWLGQRLGDERCLSVYPFRELLDSGIRLAGASDGPIESRDVLHAIQVCVTRDGFQPHQCITVEEALRMYTIDAAYAQFEDDIKGSITPGKRADLVILGDDPLAVAADRIRDIPVIGTIAGGASIYSR